MEPEGVTTLRVERASANDDEILLVRCFAADSELVAEGQVLAELETSKSSLEVLSPASGYVFFCAREQDILHVDDLLAVIAPAPDFDVNSLPRNRRRSAPEAVIGGPRASRAARELLAAHGLDPRIFIGTALLTEADVKAYLQTKTETLSKNTPIRPAPEIGQEGVVVGAGGHARVCIETLRRMGTFKIAGIAASDRSFGDVVLGVPVIALDTDTRSLYERGFRFVVNGVGAVSQHSRRSLLYARFKEAGFQLASLIDPSAVVDGSVTLGEGSQVLAQAVVGSGARIGDNCIVNSAAVVSHDVVLSNNVHVAPGALLAGGVMVGHDTLIGMGVKIHLKVQIGSGVTIHSGCIVTRDVPNNAVVKSLRF